MKQMNRRWISVLLALIFTATLALPVFAQAQSADVLTGASTDATTSASTDATTAASHHEEHVRSEDFNSGWKFHLGEEKKAYKADYSDSSWRDVTLPHDYSIEQDYTPTAQGESGYLPGGIGWYRKTFTVPEEDKGKNLTLDFEGVYMNATVYLNGEKLGDHPYGYSPFSFNITDLVNYGGENVVAVRVNNKLPSSRWYSGSGIYRDVKLTKTNTAHIARNGVVVTTPNIDKGDGSIDVKTTVRNDGKEPVEVRVKQITIGQEPVRVKHSTKFTLQPGEQKAAKQTIKIDNPKLWSPDSPNLYKLKTEVEVGGQDVDAVVTTYGYKWVSADSNNGFYLNGKPLKLKGVCLHHDQGSLGAVNNRAAIERQLRILKEMGCNSIRTSHNPPSADLVELCDEYGFLLIEELYDGWHANKNVNLHDFSESFYGKIPGDSKLVDAYEGEYWSEYSLKSTIARDRNSASVFMWSLGNEVEGAAMGVAFDRDGKKLVKWANEADPTRMVTTADSVLKYYDKIELPDHTNLGDMQTSAAASGMVGGNYVHGDAYDAIHKNHPDWKLYGSEDASAVSSRSVYKRTKDLPDHQITSYDEVTKKDRATISWAKQAAEAWYDTIQRDFVAGEYVWTGFDYLGEPTPWNSEVTIPRQGFPAPKSSYFGIVDLAGFPKDSYYFYTSQWREDKTTLHVLPQWNEDMVQKDKNGNVKVVVYSNAKSVELFFTPKGSDKKVSLGKKTFTEKKSNTGMYRYQVYEGEGKSDTDYENLYLSWNVPYADGTVTAVAYDKNGNVIEDTIGQSSVTNNGPADHLEAHIYGDRKSISADGKDLAYIEVSVVDKDGRIVPDAENRITVKVNGKSVKLVAVDNGNAYDMQKYQDDNRKAFGGRFLAIVQSTGETGSSTITLTGEGVKSTTVTVNAK